MDHLLPTANGRRHGRNSWTPEYALSDTKYAVRYRSTGNIFNLRDYSSFSSDSEEVKPRSQDNKINKDYKRCSIRCKDVRCSSTALNEHFTLQIPSVVLSSTDNDCKKSICLDSSTQLNGNGNNLCKFSAKSSVANSLTTTSKKHILVISYWQNNTYSQKIYDIGCKLTTFCELQLFLETEWNFGNPSEILSSTKIIGKGQKDSSEKT